MRLVDVAEHYDLPRGKKTVRGKREAEELDFLLGLVLNQAWDVGGGGKKG